MEFPVALISDLHLVEKNLEQFRICCEQIKQLQVKTLVILGDIFDSPDSVKWICLLEFFDFISSLPFEIFILTGNHDRPLFGQNFSSLKVFQDVATIVTHPVEISDSLWVPYMDESEAASAISDSTAQVCFSHHMVRGVKLNQFTVTTQGLEKSLFKKFKVTFNGHIHQPQVVDSLFILGSPWQHSFAEAGQEKYIWIWDGKTVRPILSKVESRYIIDTFKNLQEQDLQHKFVKVLLQPADNPQEIATYLEFYGASRWVFQQYRAEDLALPQAERSLEGTDLDVLLRDFAESKEYSLDETNLGLHFLRSP